MGFESFQVELGRGPATDEDVIKTLLSRGSVLPDNDSIVLKGSAYFLRRDGRHVIEMEISGSPAEISCRFTLCHPASVDAAFLAWVKELMESFQMRVRIRDDVTAEHEHDFSLEQFGEFSKACLYYIAERRREWQAAFGNQQLAATTAEAHQHIILPHCEPQG